MGSHISKCVTLGIIVTILSLHCNYHLAIACIFALREFLNYQ